MAFSRRRVLVLSAVLAAPTAFAQPGSRKPARLGLIAPTPIFASTSMDGFRAGLRDLGYVEGKNVVLEFRSADGDYTRLPALVRELAALKVDLIVAVGTPATLAAKEVTGTVPIVMIGVADPVRSGIVSSLARPGGNVTGAANQSPDLMRKRLEFLNAAKPGIRRVGVMLNSSNPAQPYSYEAIRPTAAAFKIELFRYDVANLDDIKSAFAAMENQKVEGLIVGNDIVLYSHAREITGLAVRQRILTAGDQQIAQAGGLIGYGSTAEVWRHGASYVDKILRGAKPGDLPIEQPLKVELVVNLATAAALKLFLPMDFRTRVDRVLE